MKQVFISYRRGSGLYMAKNIATYLSSHGYNVFFDYDSMENGVFDKQIFTAIENSNDFILVLTENSLDNCVNPDDWVRAEILCAKEHNKNIILATDAERFKSYPQNLPSELDFLRKIDWTPIHPKLFDGSMNILTKRLKSHSNKLRLLYAVSIGVAVILLLFAAYLYFPAKMTTALLDDEDEYPVNILADYDYYDNELEEFFEENLPDEVTLILARVSSKNHSDQLLIQIEDLEELDADEYNVTEEQMDAYVRTMANFTVREYYLQVKKGMASTQPLLHEDFTPVSYNTGNYNWLIYRFLDQGNEKENWRMSAKISDTLYANVIVTSDKMNFISEKRFVINLKRMLDNIDPKLMEYIRKEYI